MPSPQETWDRMNSAFRSEFDVGLEQTFNIFAMRTISTREDDADLTAEQIAWLKGWEASQ